MFKRGKIYYISINGVKESTGTADRERARQYERDRRNEEFDKTRGHYVKTWDEACLAWLEEHQTLASYNLNCGWARFWTKHLTGLKLPSITKELVHSVMVKERGASLAQKLKTNATANNYVGFVEKIIRSGSNLKPSLQYYPQVNDAKRWLRPEEWLKLESTMRAHGMTDLRHICTFALATGLRESNDINFEWSWLHGNAAAYLPRQVTKTEADYGIPLNTVAQGIIEERRRATVRHQTYVFTENGVLWKVGRLLDRLHAVSELAGIGYMNFHTFRHTFASWLAQRGVSDAIRKRLGCWTLGSDAASGYVHFDVEPLRPFAELVFPSECMAGAVGVDSAGEKAS